MVSTCSLCNGRVLSHSRILNCSVCQCQTHIQCLPQVNHTDSIFTERNRNSWICTYCVQDIFPFNYTDDDELFMSTLSFFLMTLVILLIWIT